MTGTTEIPPKPGVEVYVGLFLTALATLMFEILLTRIFCVTIWFHFAFMSVSVAMFGMTVGAILVYLLPQLFTAVNNKKNLSISSGLFSITILGSFIMHANIPFIDPVSHFRTAINVFTTYVVIAMPFAFSGIATCLCLTKYRKEDVGKLYAADLLGAGLGCLLLIPLLNIIDGPSAVIMVACLAAIAAIFFAYASPYQPVAIALVTVLILLAGSNAVLFANHQQFIKLRWELGSIPPPPLYEKWNSFSRIVVTGNPNELQRPTAWGLSSKWPQDKKVSELVLRIDAGAETVLTKFDGDFSKVEYLKYDLTNLAHHIRPSSKALIIGVGGGRDLLSALNFQAKSIDGIEINNNILDALTNVFGGYTGHLERYPNVHLFNDEARSFISKSRDKYDIIQISLVDTLTASNAGAFVLAEHTLYTVQAWKSFLSHLNTNGILTVSRWYSLQHPGEILRLISLARTTLEEMGSKNARNNIVIVAALSGANGGRAIDGIGTLLVSKVPFSKHDLEIIEKFADHMSFTVILSPNRVMDNTTAALANGGPKAAKIAAAYPLIIDPPTDDSPFFLHMWRLKDVLNPSLEVFQCSNRYTNPIWVLGILLITVLILCLLCIIIPLVLTTDKTALKDAAPLLAYFANIGMGFMLIEVSQMQRLVVFLGHPVYALTVVLFTLLIASGIGSWSTSFGNKFSSSMRLMTLFGVLSIFGLMTPYAILFFDSSGTITRILASIVILTPIGLFMGMAFPIGMKIANLSSPKLTPWLWGINGAFSVCASVIAVVISLTLGITATFWTGNFCYTLAIISFLIASNRNCKASPNQISA